jgi:hypothetical protein
MGENQYSTARAATQERSSFASAARRVAGGQESSVETLIYPDLVRAASVLHFYATMGRAHPTGIGVGRVARDARREMYDAVGWEFSGVPSFRCVALH